jgi:hypothetical protein
MLSFKSFIKESYLKAAKIYVSDKTKAAKNFINNGMSIKDKVKYASYKIADMNKTANDIYSEPMNVTGIGSGLAYTAAAILGKPTKEIKTLRDKMKKNVSESLYNPDKIANRILYHGTSPENAEQIMRYGFDPAKSKYDSEIHLTSNFAEASKYSKIANKGKLGVVLAIHKQTLDPKHISHDNSGIVKYKAPIDKQHIRKFL